MHNLLMVIPFAVCLILFLFFRKRVVWWEYCLVFVPSLLIVYCGAAIMINVNCTDTEWLNYAVHSVRYYEPWDEWVEQTCTREILSGYDSKGYPIYTTEKYDCSYRRYHDEKYTILIGDGNDKFEQEIKKTFYYKVLRRWIIPGHNEKVFRDMKRNYYRIDGDMYETSWNGRIDDYFTFTLENTYTNKVKASKSIFNFEYISDDEKFFYGLYDYHKMQESPDYGPVLGWTGAGDTYQKKVYGSNNKELLKRIEYINGELGCKYQLNFLLCIYNAVERSKETAFKQQSYWEGGNKNEMVVCIGVDSLARKIKWSKVFSWSETPELECRIEQFFIKYDSLSVRDTFSPFANFIKNNIHYWKRKEFKDFDYLQPEISSEQFDILLWSVVIWCIIASGISVFNNVKYDDNGNIVKNSF